MVGVGLLDVNALIALFWKPHPFHESCQRWMGTAGRSGWATCAMTEAGLVRILSNPAFAKRPPSVHQAIELLELAKENQPGHRFWKDEISLAEIGARWKPPLGHKQVTDAYLLSLVVHCTGKIVTFDGRMQHLAKMGGIPSDSITLLTK